MLKELSTKIDRAWYHMKSKCHNERGIVMDPQLEMTFFCLGGYLQRIYDRTASQTNTRYTDIP